MPKINLNNELTRINNAYKKQASSIMGEMNSRGILYSSFTIRERINNSTNFCNKEFTELIINFNRKKDQVLINAQIDKIIKSEKDSLKVFCKQTKNIKCINADFAPLREMKDHINNKIFVERRKRITNTVSLIVAILTLIFSTISVIQWFIPRANMVAESEAVNE